MTQIYSDPSREDDQYALPDVEVFYADKAMLCEMGWAWDEPAGEWRLNDAGHGADVIAEELPVGWYWQACFPGCLPDGGPNGPFTTEDEAIKDAQDDGMDGVTLGIMAKPIK